MSYFERERRFLVLRNNEADSEVYKYLRDILNPLYIEVCGDYEGTVIDLMKRGTLEGWCWQTTNTSIIFFQDEDYISRGNLYFDKEQIYYHSWVCFKYNNQEYVFDPCLNICCKKSLFDKVFEVDVKGIASAKVVREDLIHRIKYPEKKKYYDESSKAVKFMSNFLSNSDYHKYEVTIHGNDDVNTTIYGGIVGYRDLMIENGKIKSLKAHYYLTL